MEYRSSGQGQSNKHDKVPISMQLLLQYIYLHHVPLLIIRHFKTSDLHDIFRCLYIYLTRKTKIQLHKTNKKNRMF